MKRPTDGPSGAARPALPAVVDGLSDALLAPFAASFEPSVPAAPVGVRARPRWEIPLLLVLLALAALLRFWDLGSYGLHRPDEDTSALPAVHVLEDGVPRFPSGMFYPRAVLQSYLMAGTAAVFGVDEWSLRAPSALMGVLVVLMAWGVGRRFLPPAWNMVLAAVVALLPGLVADSQEARMYIFLVGSLAAYILMLLRWERTGSPATLAGAVLLMYLAIHFQQIALFSSLLVFFPALVSGDRKRFYQAMVAFVAIGVGYLAITWWTQLHYPTPPASYGEAASDLGVPPEVERSRFALWMGLPLAAAAGLLAWRMTRGMSGRVPAVIVGAGVIAGVLLQGVLLYFAAFLVLLATVVFARRNGGAKVPALVLLAVVCGLVAAVQGALLYSGGTTSLRKLAGMLLGRPSVWPMIRLGAYSPLALLALMGGGGYALWRLSRRERISDVWLFVLLGFAIPVVVLGFFAWYVPPRYAVFALLPMLIGGVAAARQATERFRPVLVPALLVVVMLVDPRGLAGAFDPGSRYPDHRAAARFMQGVERQPGDLVLAEEVLMQTYYLGKVDYWLVGAHIAARFVEQLDDGRVLDFYTHTPVIGRPEELQALLDRPDRGAIYVIGSGEDMHDGRQYLRGPGLHALLTSDAFRVIYEAPDGLTKVYKADAPAAVAASASSPR